uniref:Uncharacterized protein n=1 Tax=Timema shepardi TaxID=629360 RepID=A0A7R9ALB8_TIMSH|nr:unnamed protein product [Timema shepardi]
MTLVGSIQVIEVWWCAGGGGGPLASWTSEEEAIEVSRLIFPTHALVVVVSSTVLTDNLSAIFPRTGCLGTTKFCSVPKVLLGVLGLCSWSVGHPPCVLSRPTLRNQNCYPFLRLWRQYKGWVARPVQERSKDTRADWTLEKVEAKELEEENNSTKNVKPKKGAALPKGRKVTVSGSETLKSPYGRRVAPMVDDELRKKYDKAVGATKAKRGKKTKEGEEKDEFDILGDTPTKSLAERLGNSPEQLEKKMATKKKETKQTKAPRTKKEPAKKIDSPKKKGRKRPSWESGSSDEVNSSDDEDGSEAVSVPVRTTTRRAAAPKKYSFGDSDDHDDDDDDDEDLELHDNKMDGDDFRPENDLELDDDDEVPAKKKTIDVSDTDSEFDVPKNKKKITKVLNTSDAMFDNLVGSGSGGSADAPVEVSSDDDMFSNKKAAPKKRMLHKIDKEATVQIQKKTVPKRATKKRIYLDDSQDEEEEIIPKKSRGKKKVESSDEEFTIEDSDF